jgi:hypothetical protein
MNAMEGHATTTSTHLEKIQKLEALIAEPAATPGEKEAARERLDALKHRSNAHYRRGRLSSVWRDGRHGTAQAQLNIGDGERLTSLTTFRATH